MRRQFKGERIYLAELDIHFPELTVAQTLSFASSSQGFNSDISRDVASMFDLHDVLDSKIGNQMIRGISGGEKRRTSLAEAFISNARFQCWDNSTRGLDSLTALRFVELLRKSTTTSQSTVVMSVYQASELMYRVKTFPPVRFSTSLPRKTENLE